MSTGDGQGEGEGLPSDDSLERLLGDMKGMGGGGRALVRGLEEGTTSREGAAHGRSPPGSPKAPPGSQVQVHSRLTLDPAAHLSRLPPRVAVRELWEGCLQQQASCTGTGGRQGASDGGSASSLSLHAAAMQGSAHSSGTWEP